MAVLTQLRADSAYLTSLLPAEILLGLGIAGVMVPAASLDPRDVIRVIHGIWYLPSGPEWREDVGRMLQLVIDGLRYGVPDRRQQPAH
jgi:hypothetical protein